MIKSKKTVAIPAPLIPTNQAYIDEYNYNHFVVQNHLVAGLAWPAFQKALAFNLYRAKPGDAQVKRALSQLFGNKCAYCESSLGTQDLHTEHYRPKAEVTLTKNPDKSGYWWLAADWDNLLPACIHCNRSPGIDHASGKHHKSGKGNHFPLLPGSPRATIAGQEATELPALLNPRFDEPANFLTFKTLRGESAVCTADHAKSSAASSQRADDTIDILGLNRPGLVNRRNAHLRKLRSAIKAFLDAARLHQKVSADRALMPLLKFSRKMVKDRWNEIYHDYLCSDDKEYLHASMKCLDLELQKAGLSLKRLLGGKSLHLPASAIQ